MHIEGKKLTDEHVGKLVTYIPRYARGHEHAKEWDVGTIKRWNEYYVFVVFDGYNAQGCMPSTLRWGDLIN